LGLLLSWLLVAALVMSVWGTAVHLRKEIEFWTMQLQPQFTDYFKNLIATFEAENPDVKVNWVDVPWSAMESKILTAVSAKRHRV